MRRRCLRAPSRASTILAFATLAATLGCGAARARRANALALAAADRQVLEGCYDCLLGAKAVYQRLSVDKVEKSKLPYLVKLFETQLLIALREKELALDSRGAIEHARALAPRLPASVDAPRLLAIVDAVLPDASGVPPKTYALLRRQRDPLVSKIGDELAWLATTPLTPAVRDYLALALDCSFWVRPRTVGSAIAGARKPPPVGPNAPPLVAYRTGICTGGDTAILARVRAAVPAFPEASYYIGKTEAMAAEETGGDDARILLEDAYKRFPRAPGVTFMSGFVGTAIGDCQRAVRYYDETIAIEPAHEFALLQRTICLTGLRKDTAAIASATQLIALETPSTQQAYYWRALNWYRRKALDTARADIEAGKRSADPAPNTLTLAGIIEHDQDSLVVAEKDLRTARGMFRGDENCTAAWYLGLVLTRTKRWVESAPVFEQAVGCYDIKVANLRYKIDRILDYPAKDEAFKRRRIASLAADSAEQRTRYYAAAFNAAGSYGNAANDTAARRMLDIASQDPKLTEQVAKLREMLKPAPETGRRK